MGGKKERVCLLKIDVMGVLFDNVTMDQALDRAEDLIKAKTGAAVFGKLPDSSNLVSILVCGGIGVLFIILGNFMPQIKQNYTFGCRTPWALNDEHNWQRTQRMGGYTFVVMGIVLLVLSFLGGLLGDIATLIVLLAAVFGGSAWIYLYSYLVYVGKMK